MIKKIYKDYSERSYHSSHKKSAMGVLSSIESSKGKTDPKFIKQSDDYAIDILGGKEYAPWLYVYSAIAGKFKEGWIPDNYDGKIVVPKLKGNYGEIASYNTLASLIFKSPLFPDVLYYTNGLWLTTNYKVIQENEAKEIAFKDTEKVVFKVDNSEQGKGIQIIEKDDFDIKKIEASGNGVFQKFIVQHPFFEKLMPHSVVTIRLTTAIDNKGIASLRACYLRIGRQSDTYVKSASHIRVPVNIETGEFNEFGFTTDWVEIEKHPDTNFVFKGAVIPNFDKCIATVTSLHTKVPFTRIIGWDLIIDYNSNAQIMEWNGSHNDIKFSEATQGPCFSDLDLDKLWKDDN